MKFPSHFYAMVDPAGGHEPALLARLLLDAGARVIQLRLKDASSRDLLAAARELAAMSRERGAMLIVDDRADIAFWPGPTASISGRRTCRWRRRAAWLAAT